MRPPVCCFLVDNCPVRDFCFTVCDENDDGSSFGAVPSTRTLPPRLVVSSSYFLRMIEVHYFLRVADDFPHERTSVL